MGKNKIIYGDSGAKVWREDKERKMGRYKLNVEMEGV